MQPKLVTREPRQTAFRYSDGDVDATLALLNKAKPNQIVALGDPQPTRSKALGRAHKMRQQIVDREAVKNGHALRKTVVQEGEEFEPAVYLVAEKKR